ncbi:MAG: hypothetical protein AAB250_13165 [Bdellovibrionota bacterium]
MRTLGQISHPEATISIFSWNGKFIVKFERGLLEQVYKFEHLDFESEAEFRAKIDSEFIASVVGAFSGMHETHSKLAGES